MLKKYKPHAPGAADAVANEPITSCAPEDEEVLLAALLESIPSAVAVVNDGHRVELCSRALERIFGPFPGPLQHLPFGEVVGCREARLSAGSCGLLAACEACAVRHPIREALAGRPVDRHLVQLEAGNREHARSLVLMVRAMPLDVRDGRKALVVIEDATELHGLRSLVGAESGFAGIIGRHPKIRTVYEMIHEVAEVASPVLLQGESDTGKELVARAIHDQGPRAHRRFVAVSCSALPEGLLESELFGHVKGAFTGAIRDKMGRFELADGGTLFLHEIGALSTAMQVKLLRVLQERSFERVGGESTVEVDVRVISASNRDLREEVAAGRFRRDLFYRLCVVPIHLPALRDRVTDIPLLADHILTAAAACSGRTQARVSAAAFEVLADHSWPGNVRELQNALEYALIKSRGATIEPSHLPLSVHRAAPVAAHCNRPAKLTATAVGDALQATRGNKLKAAKLLGVGRATLYRFLAEAAAAGVMIDLI